jgi:anti-anti-sigma factor
MNSPSQRIELQGEYDLADKEPLAKLLGSLRADGPAEIDMTKVTYIDSTALHELASLRTRFNAQPITLRVRENICRVLDLMRFDRLFDIVVVGSDAA